MKTEKFKKVLRVELKNGLTVLLQEHHVAPVVAVQVWVDTGSADESGNERGLAHFHEHMLFKGTATRRVGEIAKSIEGAGGDINAWTSYDNTVYHVVLASRYLDLGLEVLADAVSNASFEEEEIGREIKVVLEEIRRTRDMPGRWIADLLFELAYRKHPYRYPILGTEKSVSNISRQDLLKFYKRHYVPANMTVVVVGDFETDSVLTRINKLLGSRKSPVRQAVNKIKEPAQRKPRLKVIRDDIKEAHFQLGWHIPAVGHDDVPALDVLAIILGQGESSRLNQRLKRGKNLVNEVFAYAYTPEDPGIFLTGGSCPAGKITRALKALKNEIEELRVLQIDASELAKAKTILESEFIYNNETVEGIARRIGYHQILLGDPGYGDKYLQKVLSLSIDDIRRVAETYLSPKRLSAIVLLPAKKPRDFTSENLQKILSARSPAKVAAAARRDPEVLRVKIENGPVVLILQDNSNALVSMRAAFLGGVRYETEENNGINNLLAGLSTRGTKTRRARELAEEIDGLAGVLDGFSGRNTFGMRGDFPSRHIDKGIELMCDCLLNPVFREEEVKRERELALEEIRNREDNLSGMAFDLFAETLYSTHPYRLSSLGTLQSVAHLNRSKIKKYFKNHYDPERMVLAVVGDVDKKKILGKIERYCVAPRKGERRRPPTIPLEAPAARIRVATKHRERNQAHVVLGFLGTTLSSRDKYALEVLLAVLAGQGGRLFVELRDRMSLAYAVSGFSLEGIEPGYIAVYLATDPRRVDEAIRAVEDQLQRVVSKEISAAELKRAKRYLVGTHAISLQRNASRAAALAFNDLYGLGHMAWREYPEHITAVTREDVRRVARKYIKTSAYSLAVIRPAGDDGS